MAYAQKKQLSGNRTLAIIIVALLQFVLGYAIVTGLAYNVIKKAAEDLKTFDVEEEPPPPEEEPPPPPPDQPQQPPPVVTPPPIVRTNVTPPPVIQQVREAPPVVITPTAPPAPPAPPPPPRKAQSAAPARGDVRNLFSGVDYSQEAGTEAEGTAVARLTIGTSGRVDNCSVVQSTGDSRLDRYVCRVLTRARFTPAKDSNGNPTGDSYTTPRITFKLQ
ncbi:TonB family protein [Sphingomonas sabuli]|uniref:TonB family protein n=1 Tax=Sphingomonas sabuli TaxID=2764186 RepID=A0A7G9L4W2_9SPHN|nr:energy transducer TonB [Sphingomonas sabuli]QNM83661.1 TonB family protein [Sphingomonas sabuli]